MAKRTATQRKKAGTSPKRKVKPIATHGKVAQVKSKSEKRKSKPGKSASKAKKKKDVKNKASKPVSKPRSARIAKSRPLVKKIDKKTEPAKKAGKQPSKLNGKVSSVPTTSVVVTTAKAKGAKASAKNAPAMVARPGAIFLRPAALSAKKKAALAKAKPVVTKNAKPVAPPPETETHATPSYVPPLPARPTSERPMKNKAGFGERDLQHFRELLLNKRREILGDVSSMEREALSENKSDLSNLPVHMADQGTDAYEQEFTLGLVENNRALLKDINDAMAKIQNGTYGLCEGTAKPISRPRLEAIPWVRYSMEFAQMREKKQGMFRR